MFGWNSRKQQIIVFHLFFEELANFVGKGDRKKMEVKASRIQVTYPLDVVRIYFFHVYFWEILSSNSIWA